MLIYFLGLLTFFATATTPEELCTETYIDLTTKRLPFYKLVPIIESLPSKIVVTPEWRKLFEEYFYKKFPNTTTKNETFEKIARDIYIRGERISKMFVDGKKIDSITLVKVCDYIGLPPEIYLKALNLQTPKTAPKTAEDKTPQKKETLPPIIIQNTKEVPIQVTPIETKKVIIPEQVASQKLPLYNFELAAVPTSMKGLIPLMEALPPRVIISEQWRILFKEYLIKKFNTDKKTSLKKLSLLSGVGIIKLGNLYRSLEGIDRVSLVKICNLINLPPEIYFKEIDTTMPKMKEVRIKKPEIPAPPRTPLVNVIPVKGPIPEIKKEEKKIVTTTVIPPPPPTPIVPITPPKPVVKDPLVELVEKNQNTPFLMAVALDENGKVKSFKDFGKILAEKGGIDLYLKKVIEAAKEGGYQQKLLVNNTPNMEFIIQMACYIAKKNGKDHNTFPGFKFTKNPKSPWEIKSTANFYGNLPTSGFVTFINSMVKQRLKSPFEVDLD